MDNSRIPVFCLLFLSFIILTATCEGVFAQEDTAHLSFEKTAPSKVKTRTYVVKEGDWLFGIMQSKAGLTMHRATIIKKLNPSIKNINRIYPGQVLILPEIEPPAVADRDGSSPSEAYTIRKGDSITRIAIRQFQLTKLSEVVKTVNEIKKLNPEIKNYDLIYPREILRLPRRSIVIAKQETKVSEAESPAQIEESSKEKQPVLPETRLAVIRHVIGRMNGSLITTGKYYIPIPTVGQVTIDCATIPAVELDDGNIILLDLFNRIPDTLKNMIQANWKNYHPIKISDLESTATTLQKIISVSKTYKMTKRTTPYIIGNNPPLQLSLEWMIAKSSSEGVPYLQGLSFITGNDQLLPKPMISYAERNGLIVTEILVGNGIVSASDEEYTIPEVPVMNTGTNIELINALLNELGYPTSKDAEIGIFDTTKEGFNVSVKADLTVKKEDKQIIILSKKIPQQFIDNLKNRGMDTLFIEEGETRKVVIGKVLQAINIPFSFNSFSFSIPEKIDNPKATITFPAFKIARDKEYFYLIDFDIDRNIYALLNDRWEVDVVKY
ncbi:MAG TPA: LysM domain-containing protein [Syntrophales bacterium]|nr:LysM domain-containing protein [Syntrophales bacterium]